MQVIGSDNTKKYIEELEKKFFQMQQYAMKQARENYLKTEFILDDGIIHDSYCDYLNRLSTNGIHDDYMNASEILNEEIERYDVNDYEIKNHIAGMISTF